MSELEREMVKRGASRYSRRVRNAERRGRASDQSKAGKGLVGVLAAGAIDALNDEVNKPVAGRGQRVNTLILMAGVEIGAGIAAKIVVDRAGFSVEKQNLSSILSAVGHAVHDQAWMQAFSHLKGHRLLEAIKVRNQDQLFGTSKLRTLVRSQLGEDWEDWTRGEMIQVGAKLVSAVIECSDHFDVKRGREGRKTKTWVQPSPGLLKRIRTQDLRIALASPLLLPMDTEPKLWVGVAEGGYRTITVPIVKDCTGDRLQTLEEQQMPEVFEAVNHLQAVPYAINADVLTVAEHFWLAGATIAGLPDQDPLPRPAFPEDQAGMKWAELSDDQKEARKAWKTMTSAIHAQDRVNTGKALSVRQTLETALQFEDRDVFFPLQLCFRGRVYPMPSFSYQADKLTKALIQFKFASPLTPAGVRWFLIHGANCWGLDKENFEDRVKWATENQSRIVECGADPIEDVWWAEADEPWPFLAWVMEAHEFFTSGASPEFESCLPIAVDATASALQHWSAALRDEDGARRVNLVDGPRRDVYSETLGVLTDLLQQSAHPMAAFLLSSPYLHRNLVKTPQMARTYGGTKRGVEDHVRRFCSHTDSMRALKSAGFGVADFCREVGGLVWDAINASLTGAKAGMDYAMQVAKAANLMGLPLSWGAAGERPGQCGGLEFGCVSVGQGKAGPRSSFSSPPVHASHRSGHCTRSPHSPAWHRLGSSPPVSSLPNPHRAVT